MPHQIGMDGATPSREYITLTEDLSDLQITPRRDVADAFSISGGRSRELLRPWQNVRIVLDRFNDRDLFRQFSGMINHLERGGAITFCNDRDKCFAARTNAIVRQNQPFLNLGEKFESGEFYTTHPDTLEAGDEIVIESGPPVGKREYLTVQSHAALTDGSGGTKIQTPGGAGGTMDEYPPGSLVRFSDLYPILIMEPGQVGGGHLTHDHRITYTLDLNLATVQTYPDPDFQASRQNTAKPNDWGN